MRLAVHAQMQAHTTDQTGVLVAFRRMTDKVGGFIDDEQLVVFVEDVEKLVQGGQ